MHLFGLIGQPLTHSFSKRYFTEKFEQLGLTDYRYELFPLASINELPALLQANPSLQGLNVTIPYKKQVLPFLSASFLPEGLNACNCIRIRDGKTEGYNTDVIGFEKSLVPLLKPHHTRAIVLGSGGAAEAVLYVLDKLGIDHLTVSRKASGNKIINYNYLSNELINSSTLIINTTPLGMFPLEDSLPPIPYKLLTDKHLLYDLIYNPAKTAFLRLGEEKGASIKNGEEMLIIQAEESWKIWNA
ncbi:MAG: shikimate dehydrogenase [Chitinophagaceae bacterium]|nr:shikimate dehydrogenase [Chitinophagaceae bacterium]